MDITFSQLEEVHEVLIEHYENIEAVQGRPDFYREDATELLQHYISAMHPIPLRLSGGDIEGFSAWLNAEVERIAEDSANDFYSGMYKALLVLVFNMLREGGPPWR